jgi:type II secretion system protein G
MNKKGFTIIEFLVVIGIIGILSTIVMAGSYYAKAYAKTQKAIADISEIAKSIDSMALDTGQWPGHQTPYVVCSACNGNEIEDLNSPEAGIKQTDGLFPNWSGPYIQVLSIDPWDNPYFYDSDYDIDGTDYAVIGSYGPNGEGTNLYDNDDIIQIINR